MSAALPFLRSRQVDEEAKAHARQAELTQSLEQGLAAQLDALGGRADVVACDCADLRDVRALLARGRRVVSVLHAAGTLRDGMLRSMANVDVETSFAPKATAAARGASDSPGVEPMESSSLRSHMRNPSHSVHMSGRWSAYRR